MNFFEIRDTLGQAFLHGVECSMGSMKKHRKKSPGPQGNRI